jgi:hypothetical protein|tara:strand:+ start:267 stop:503 length:237 start_codon:yes stop_codon:yes gene_type:complete
MAKRDYKSSSLRLAYRGLVKTNRDTKVVVDVGDKRARAELLDTVEDLFQGGSKSISPDKLRAFLTMLVLSMKNSTDDR